MVYFGLRNDNLGWEDTSSSRLRPLNPDSHGADPAKPATWGHLRERKITHASGEPVRFKPKTLGLERQTRLKGVLT